MSALTNPRLGFNAAFPNRNLTGSRSLFTTGWAHPFGSPDESAVPRAS
jgi:hypothetical protein